MTTISKPLFSVDITNGQYRSSIINGTFLTPYNSVKRRVNPNNTVHLVLPILDTGDITGIKDKLVYIRVLESNNITFVPVNNYVREVNKENKHVSLQEPVVEETEEQALNRIRLRFKTMDKLTEGVAAGVIKSLIISGPAGVGKSFGIEKSLDVLCKLRNYKYEIIKGYATPVNVYKKLYEFRDEKSILVFDDCDGIFYEEVALNLFKAALDSSDTRIISYLAESKTLREENIPNSFEFKGAVVFISNLNFKKIRSDKIREHLAALQSRSHYLDLTINNEKDKFYRIKQIILDTPILSERGFSEEHTQRIMNFIESNLSTLREVSLRLVKKISDLAFYDLEGWEELASLTLLKNS